MAGRKPSILAIDDEENFTDMLKQYFSIRDYDIDVVSDGTRGIEAFRSKKYDVVLLDLKMVGINGDEVMKRMKEIDKDVKAVFITAFPDSGKTKGRLMELGAYAYLEKPLNSLKVLENIVNSALKDRNGKGGEDA